MISGDSRKFRETWQVCISQNETAVPRTSSAGVSAVVRVMDGTSEGGEAISHDGDDSLSDNATCSKRPRSSNSKALFLQGAARSEREQPRPRQRRQPEYSTRGREEQFNRRW